jgi:hypothetical protein
MKKNLAILFLFCLFANMQAQSGSSKKSTKFNSIKGYFSKTYTNRTSMNNSMYSFYHGFGVGANYTWWITRSYSLHTGINFNRLSVFSKQYIPDTTIYRGPYREPLPDPAKTRKSKHHTFYISIPVNTKYYLNELGDYYLIAGINMDIFFYRNIISKDYYNGKTDHLASDKYNYLNCTDNNDNSCFSFKDNVGFGFNAAVGREFKNKQDFVIDIEFEVRAFSVVNFNNSGSIPFYAGINVGIDYFFID